MKDISKEDIERIEKFVEDRGYDNYVKYNLHILNKQAFDGYITGLHEGATAEHAHLSETIQELKVWQEKTNAFVDKLGQENQKLKEDIALLKERDEKNGEGWAEDLKKLEAENQSLRDRVAKFERSKEFFRDKVKSLEDELKKNDGDRWYLGLRWAVSILKNQPPLTQ